MSHHPFWQRPAPLPPGQPPRRIEVVVVGGGVTGVALLHHLHAAGIAAVVLERDHLGSGATGRNAGFLLTGTAEHYAAAVRAYGRTVARDVWAFTSANHDLLLEALGPMAAGAAGHRRAGAWTLATSDLEASELRDSVSLLADDGLGGSFVATPEGVPSGWGGGLLMPGDGEIDPVVAVSSLARRCLTERPGSILESVAVRGLEASTGGLRVQLDSDEIDAGAVILATNAWAAELAPQLPVTPVRAQMLATAAQPTHARAPGRPAYSHRGHRYWRRLRGGELLLGGCREVAAEAELTSVATPSRPIQAALDQFLRTDLAVAAEVTHRWAGIMGFSPDGLPLVGAVPGTAGLFVCGGYTGHGMGFAVHAARTLVRHLAEGAAIPRWLDPARPGVSGQASG